MNLSSNIKRKKRSKI